MVEAIYLTYQKGNNAQFEITCIAEKCALYGLQNDVDHADHRIAAVTLSLVGS